VVKDWVIWFNFTPKIARMKERIGIVGSGAMGSGIAQVAAQAGHEVHLTDTRKAALDDAESALSKTLERLAGKGKMSPEDAGVILSRIHFTTAVDHLSECDVVIEAIVEDLSIKQSLFKQLESVVASQTILASNTSSLSITAIAGACQRPERVLGIHFFNPAPLMPLVEIIPGLQTETSRLPHVHALMTHWGKTPVLCKDTPGFIVNRVARPFYSEALRILDERIADAPTIDAAMRDVGFRMGPFELMDLIGNDVNYAVTESVFRSFYFDPRYRPSTTQKRLVEAGWLGRKSGRGFYRYDQEVETPVANPDTRLRNVISSRILCMLFNEAYDALYLGVASEEDLDLAMTRGVNYPKGLISWGQEWGLENVRQTLGELYSRYQEDRYRCSRGLFETE